MWNDELNMLLKVVLAAFLSGVIGFERERGDKPAGIRTNMLVGGAVALLVQLGEVIVEVYAQSDLSAYINADPTRIIHAIIVGISFIGAGMVLQIEKEHRIMYLTTSATILFSTGISIAVALGQYVLAISITLFILFVNFILGLMGKRWKRKKE